MRPSQLIVALSLLGATACTGFREGAPGIFRSPHAREEQMIRRLQQHDIRTLVCLRGGRTARQSARAALAADANFVSIPISAKRAPRPEALLRLWDLGVNAKRPILVHCRAGVDRTGLALALITLHDTGDLEAARAHLAFVPNGHIAAFGTEAMDHVLDLYEPFVGVLTFPTWVERVYAADYARSATVR